MQECGLKESIVQCKNSPEFESRNVPKISTIRICLQNYGRCKLCSEAERKNLANVTTLLTLKIAILHLTKNRPDLLQRVPHKPNWLVIFGPY